MGPVRRTAALTAASVALLAGCGNLDARESAATDAAVAFQAALRAADHAAACAALAPATRDELAAQLPCPTALEETRLPVAGAAERTDVYGRQARVVLHGDTLFLSRFPEGWLVTAAGCRPRPGAPYECAVEGG